MFEWLECSASDLGQGERQLVETAGITAAEVSPAQDAARAAGDVVVEAAAEDLAGRAVAEQAAQVIATR
jgi:hypothetical protein